MITLAAGLFVGLAAALLTGSGQNLLATRLRSRGGETSMPVPLPGRMPRQLGVGALLHRVRRRPRPVDRAATVAEACVVVAAELAAGRPPPLALRTAAGEWPDLFQAPAGRAEIGGDVGAALRHAAAQPGAESLLAVGAAWDVSNRTGARLSDTLLSVADSLRDEAAIRQEVRTQLATVRVTARLMAVLPVVTLGMFSAGSDGEPLLFLVSTPYGLACLAGAAALAALGLFWVERTAHRATRSAWAP